MPSQYSRRKRRELRTAQPSVTPEGMYKSDPPGGSRQVPPTLCLDAPCRIRRGSLSQVTSLSAFPVAGRVNLRHLERAPKVARYTTRYSVGPNPNREMSGQGLPAVLGEPNNRRKISGENCAPVLQFRGTQLQKLKMEGRDSPSRPFLSQGG